MNSFSLRRAVAALGAAAALAPIATAAAQAGPHHVNPVTGLPGKANGICRHAAVAKRLTDDQRTAIASACDTLRGAVTDATSAFSASVQQVQADVKAARDAAKSACAQAHDDACRQAVQDFRTAMRNGKATVKAARGTYDQAVRDALGAFRTAVQAALQQ